MKYNELNQKSEDELKKDLQRLREEVGAFRVKIRLAQAKNTHQYKVLRQDIARVMTALRQKRS